jgi:hypothetical protein
MLALSPKSMSSAAIRASPAMLAARSTFSAPMIALPPTGAVMVTVSPAARRLPASSALSSTS